MRRNNDKELSIDDVISQVLQDANTLTMLLVPESKDSPMLHHTCTVEYTIND